MTTLQLDENGDVKITNNAPVMVSGGDEVEQRLRCNLQCFLAEWFLDLEAGTPWRQVIFEKAASDNTVASAIKNVILETPGVLELRAYQQTINRTTRELVVYFSVLSTDGEIIFDNEVLSP